MEKFNMPDQMNQLTYDKSSQQCQKKGFNRIDKHSITNKDESSILDKRNVNKSLESQ